MNKLKETFGYALGFVLFVVLIPVIMWLCSKMPAFSWPHPFLAGIAIFCAIGGLFLSIWAIVYMRRVGDGNPMDAFDHELAPRTSVLMTEGPYRLCRNPMLLGVFLYDSGLLICLWSWKALAVFAVYAALMMRQVASEEKRLERDFGEAYLAYKAKTRKLIPFLW